jgi:hypothetical protein
MIAAGAGLPIYDYDSFPETGDLLIRGITKISLIKRCWTENRTFFYMDGGYFGNYPNAKNPRGDKLYHRIVKNNLQHTEILKFPSDRWEALGQPIKPRKPGKHVLLVVPSEKPCKFYGIDLQAWIANTVELIKKHTDRPIIIRMKGTRRDRLTRSIFEDFVNAHATVTLNSVAAVESILEGIPAITLAPTAADPVAERQIANIENPFMPDPEMIFQWASGLAYGQYHIDELKNGSVYKLIYEHS